MKTIVGNAASQLARLSLFEGLFPQAIDAILHLSGARKVEEGAYFFMQEDNAERLYVLVEGRVKLGLVSQDGQQIILNVLGPWHAFGAESAIPGAVYPVSAQAVLACTALGWEKAVLQRVMTKYPQITSNLMRHMSKQIVEAQDRIRELTLERVERRVARLLLRLARQVGKKTDDGVLIDLPISRQDMAEMSGTTLYSVSRILSQWERNGLIDAGREKVIVRFPHGLVQIAEDLPANK